MLCPRGRGLPVSHLGVPTTLRAENGHQRRVLGHGSTPSRLCLGGAVSDSEGIRRVSRLWCWYHTIERSPQAAHTKQCTGRLRLQGTTELSHVTCRNTTAS
jgi:hypothetical protein